MRIVSTYMEFLNEEFFKKFGNNKPSKSSNISRIDSCVKDILSFLKENEIYDWNDFMSMSVFDRDVINKIIDHEVKTYEEVKEVNFLVRIELSDVSQLKEYLKEFEQLDTSDGYRKCAKIVQKINSKR